jgi:hypothetical protein
MNDSYDGASNSINRTDTAVQYSLGRGWLARKRMTRGIDYGIWYFFVFRFP